MPLSFIKSVKYISTQTSSALLSLGMHAEQITVNNYKERMESSSDQWLPEVFYYGELPKIMFMNIVAL